MADVAPGLAASTQCVRRFESTEPGAVVHLPEPALSLSRIMDRLEKPSCSGNSVEVLIDAEQTFSRIHSAARLLDSSPPAAPSKTLTVKPPSSVRTR